MITLHEHRIPSAAAWTRQFSLPDADANGLIFDTIVNANGIGVATWLLDTHGAVIDRSSSGLAGFIRDWIASPGPADTPWDISFGRVHLAMKEGRLVDPLDAAVRLGLRIARSGHHGTWQAPVGGIAVQVDGVLVEDVNHVAVDNLPAQAPRIVLRQSPDREIALRRSADDGRWTANGGSSTLETVGRSGTIRLLPRCALPSEDCGGEIFKECQPVTTIDECAARSFHDGFSVLEANAPQYVPWIERVLHGIVVCPQQSQYRLVSGSWEDVPGYVHMSSPHGGIDIAEVLVHECAHQYFYMLQRVGPVDDASDGTLYWSPPIRRARPLSRVLMAYHALANVQRLYHAVRGNVKNGEDVVRYVVANEPDLQTAIRILDEPLRDNRALTGLGRGLYEPLAAHMTALGVCP